MHTRRLSPADTSLLLEFLNEAPNASIAMRGMVSYANLSMFPWVGLFQNKQLRAVSVYIPQQLALVWANQTLDCEPIGEALRAFGPPCTAIGPREAMPSLWSGWTTSTPRITAQTLYVASSIPSHSVVSEFRLAHEDESEQIAKLAGAGEAAVALLPRASAPALGLAGGAAFAWRA